MFFRKKGVLEREADGDAAFGRRVGEGVADVGTVDVGLEEGSQGQCCTECIFCADFRHPDFGAGGYLAGVLVDFADLRHVAVVGEVSLED